ncbi:MAG: bacteriohemerythrin [Mariprofundales bacterium]|nr:bacteriohemerythrin [Mariprofundales bacterium]
MNVTARIASWSLKHRLSSFWFLFLLGMLAAGATHETGNYLIAHDATQLKQLNGAMGQVAGLRASIFAEHARHLMYLYTGDSTAFDNANSFAEATTLTLDDLIEQLSKASLKQQLGDLKEQVTTYHTIAEFARNQFEQFGPGSDELMDAIVNLDEALQVTLSAQTVIDEHLSTIIDQARKDAAASRSHASLLFWGIILLMLLLVLPLMLRLVIQSIVTPLQSMVEATRRIANGDLNFTLGHQEQGAPIGELAHAIDKAREDAREMHMVQQMAAQFRLGLMMADAKSLNITYINPAAVALFKKIEAYLPCSPENMIGENIDIFHKDPGRIRGMLADESNLPMTSQFVISGFQIRFTAAAIRDSSGQLEQIMVTWEDATSDMKRAYDFQSGVGVGIGRFGGVIKQFIGNFENLSVMMVENSQQARRCKDAANTTARQVAIAVENTDSLSASINHMAAAVEQAHTASTTAVTQTKSTQETMEKLAHSSTEIEQIAQIISGIARSTNLLALNATIEAAAAGKAGAGFAVVANEVKELAGQTAQATNKISDMVSHIRRDSDESVAAINAIAKTIHEVGEVNARIAADAQIQKKSANQIQQAMSQAHSSVQIIDQDIDSIHQITIKAEDVASQMLITGHGMEQSVAEMSTTVRQLLSELGVDLTDQNIFMPWSDVLLLGIDEIDEQHHEFINIINSLYASICDNRERDAVEEIIHNLQEYTAKHFALEEGLLHQYDYPGVTEHTQSHQVEREAFDRMLAKHLQGEDIGQELLNFLRDWLFHHILNTDREYAPFLVVKMKRGIHTVGNRA